MNDELKNGPLEERGCTDILCCLLFIIAMGVFAGIAIFGFTKGSPKNLGVPFDPDSKRNKKLEDVVWKEKV